MPASLITLPQSAVSSAKNLLVSAGVVAPAAERNLAQQLADILALENLDHVAVDLLRQGGGRGGRRDQSEPGDRLEARQSRLGKRRNLRDDAGALQIGDGQELELAVAVERHRGGERIEEQVDVAGEDIGERGLRAAVGHVHHLDAGLRFQLSRREVRRRAHPLRGVGQLAGIGLAVGDELLERVCRQLLAHDQDIRDGRQHGDRNEPGRIVAGVAIEQVIERQRGGRSDQQRIAVRRRARDVAGADIHRAAGDVLDNRRLAPFLAELVRHDACERVGGRAGRPRHHDLHRAGWIGLLRNARPKPKRATRGGNEPDQAGKAGHSFLPFVFIARHPSYSQSERRERSHCERVNLGSARITSRKAA